MYCTVFLMLENIVVLEVAEHMYCIVVLEVAGHMY